MYFGHGHTASTSTVNGLRQQADYSVV